MPRGGMASRWTHQIGIPLSDPCPYEGRKSISQYVILFINICIYIYTNIQDVSHSEFRICCLCVIL